jgi:beta-lactamase regulating signal transducer with metallopeptidase domain/thiol-disulfide isomerase/thioredoxin
MSIIEFFSQPVWQRIGLTLIHFLWQGLIIAILIGACVRVFKPSHGNARYIVYLLAFIAMISCPVVTFIAIDIPISQDKDLFIEIEPVLPFNIISDTVFPEDGISLEADSSTPNKSRPNEIDYSTPLRERIYSYLYISLPWFLVIWIIGVVIQSVRLLIGFVGIHRWRLHLVPLPEWLAQRTASLSKGLGIGCFSRVFMSSSVIQVMAVGYLRPIVLLPAAMVMQMQPEMLEAVIAHELAHIRRFDLWVNLVQRIIETLLFYHPAVWWLSSCLRSERELCCDELAVRATGERLTYASALESVVRAKLITKQPTFAVGLNQDNKPILQRVRHILGFVPTRRNHPFWLAGAIAVIFLTVLAISTMLVLATKTRSGANSETVMTANSEDVSATMPKPVTLDEFIKGWLGQGTMNIRVASPAVAQRKEADMMGSTTGVILSTLREGSAKEAGLQLGDYIVRIADIDVRSNHHLIALTRSMSPGSKVNVEFVRKGKKMAVDVVLDPITWDESYPILAGNVLLPNGQPAIGAMVYARVYYDSGSISDALPYLTDKLGRFIAKFSSKSAHGRCFLLATTHDGFAGYTIVDFPIKIPTYIQLKKGKITKGRLFTDKGEGIPDILMEVEGIAIAGEEKRFGMYPKLRTDRNGWFTLPALPVGSKVQLNFEVAGYAQSSRGPYSLAQIEEGFLFGEEGIPLGASIEGVVVASDTGKALGPFSLSWRNASVNIRKSIQVNTEGRFKADTLPSGETSFYISVSEMRKLGYTLTPKVINLNPGEKVIDLQLTAEPFGVIKGKVTDKTTKQGIAGFTVSAGNEAFVGDRFRTATEADGTYRLPIPAGDILFTFREAQNHRLRINPGQEIDGIDFVGKTTANTSEKDIIFNILDPNGLPVSGAKVGKHLSNFDDTRGEHHVSFNSVQSDEKGLVSFQKDDLFQERNQDKKLLLYALETSQKLVGFLEISLDDSHRVIEWQLKPACRVKGRLESSSLEKLEQNLEWTNVYVYKDNYRPLSYSSKAGQFEFFLPTGSYKLNAYGTSAYSINREIEIKRGQKELEVKLDLPADRLATLIGKTAPEFRNIKGWINSEPLKLANLRDKLVLLDFWGYWCGPCIAAMPNLVQLHDKFSKHDLIIIAVHDDSLGSIAELQQKLKDLSKERWSGQQISFAIALDGGGETKIEGTDRSTRGATSAAYGIQAWPTSILIDRDGNVIKKFHPSNPDAIEELQYLLGEQFTNQLLDTGQAAPTGWVGGVIRAKGLGSYPTIHLIRADNNIGLWNPKDEFTRMDENGNYAFFNVPIGNYWLQAKYGSMSGDSVQTKFLFPVKVLSLRRPNWVNFEYQGGSNSIEVKCPGFYSTTIWSYNNKTKCWMEWAKYLGKMLPNKKVEYMEQYEFKNLPPGNYGIVAVRQVNGNVLTQHAQLELKENQHSSCVLSIKQDSAILEGTVIGNQGGISGLCVIVRKPGSGPIQFATIYEASTRDSIAVIRGLDRDGSYRCTALPAGKYTITAAQFLPSQHQYRAPVQQVSKLVELKEGQTTKVNFDLLSKTNTSTANPNKEDKTDVPVEDKRSQAEGILMLEGFYSFGEGERYSKRLGQIFSKAQTYIEQMYATYENKDWDNCFEAAIQVHNIFFSLKEAIEVDDAAVWEAFTKMWKGETTDVNDVRLVDLARLKRTFEILAFVGGVYREETHQNLCTSILNIADAADEIKKILQSKRSVMISSHIEKLQANWAVLAEIDGIKKSFN